MKLRIVQFPEPPLTSSVLRPHIILNILFPNPVSVCSYINMRDQVLLRYIHANIRMYVHNWTDSEALTVIYPWLYSPCGPWPLLQFLNLHAVGRTPWTGDQPFTRPLPTHRINARRHQCLERNLNPRSQCWSAGRQSLP
jgi:hypothetical protein